MVKSTIQILLETKDLEFLSKLMQSHNLKNNSQAVRLMISRYKGMEDYIRNKKLAESTTDVIRKAKIIID